MKRLSAVTRHGQTNLVVCGLAILLIMLFLSACGDGSDSGDISLGSSQSEIETGSAMLKIKWQDASIIKGDLDSLAEEALDCEGAGVATITCKVYDDTGNLLTNGDPWPCSEHSGSLDGIPVGQDRIFVILGEDADGNINFQGQKLNITIDQIPDNDVGTIEAHSFVPEGLTATTNSAVQIGLTWTQPSENVAPAGYRIYRDGALVGTSASTSYIDAGLTQETQYCYTISAYDQFSNESASSEQACATTGVSADEEPPTIPTGLTASAISASQIELSWTASSDNVGVTEYRIFRDGNQTGTTASTAFSDMGLIQNTRYCYTVEAYDAAGNPSGESAQACETTMESFDWYRDSDNDSYGDPNDSVTSETQPTGYVSDYSDCDDADASINPGADEACNGIDDDCDGSVDEELTRPTTCGVGACSGNTGTETCTDGDWGNDTCDPLDGATAERCDNVDNDCDGSVDEGLTRQSTCGVGACSGNTGTETCTAGNWGDDTCDPLDGATAERCDNVDNDCDGSVDEGLTRSTSCGVGACSGNSGTETCTAGNWGDDSCDPLDGATAERCDNVDNDCDGSVDEGLTRSTSCGVGACSGNSGTETCTAGNWGNDTCDPLDGATAERCDNVDNDCDGSVDEDLTRSTSCGVGACAGNTGTETCTDGDWGDDTCDPLDGATAEACDNVDNDCDGSVDEGLTRQSTCGVGACAGNTGTETCTDGDWGDDTCDPLDGATAEACDNVDNDCDGSVDEGLTRQSTCGVGACAGNTGTETCTDGDWGNDTCDPLDGATSERCDNVDNDCDGSVDEGLTRQSTCGSAPVRAIPVLRHARTATGVMIPVIHWTAPRRNAAIMWIMTAMAPWMKISPSKRPAALGHVKAIRVSKHARTVIG